MDNHQNTSPRVLALGDESIDMEWFIYSFVVIPQDSDVLSRLVQQMRKSVRERQKTGMLSAKAVALINNQLHEHLLARQYEKIWEQCLDAVRVALITHPGQWWLFSVRMPIKNGVVSRQTRRKAYATVLATLQQFLDRQGLGPRVQLSQVILHTLPSDIDSAVLKREVDVTFAWTTASHRDREELIIADWIAGIVRRAQRHTVNSDHHHKTAARCVADWRVRIWDRAWPNA